MLDTWDGVAMPNQPRPDNPVRGVRIEDSLWSTIRRVAQAEGVTVSDIVRKALIRYVSRKSR